MPGPLPKNAATRQRRNPPKSRAILPAEAEPILEKPELPKLPGRQRWHMMAQQFWDDVWASPMQAEFLRGDLPALFRLVFLVHTFWKSGDLAVGREIRLMETQFGLTPLARRRLEWSVAQAEEAKDKHHLRRAKRATIMQGSDPRGVLD